MPNCIEILCPKRKFRKKQLSSSTIVQSIRIDIKELQTIKEVCAQLGISKNFFINWCAYSAAVYIKKHDMNRKK